MVNEVELRQELKTLDRADAAPRRADPRPHRRRHAPVRRRARARLGGRPGAGGGAREGIRHHHPQSRGGQAVFTSVDSLGRFVARSLGAASPERPVNAQ